MFNLNGLNSRSIPPPGNIKKINEKVKKINTTEVKEKIGKKEQIPCLRLPHDKVLDLFTYKLDAGVMYKSDGSVVVDQGNFFKNYDINSITLPPPYCSRCRSCNCHVQKLTEEELAVSEEMRRHLVFDEKERKFKGKYVFREDPNKLDLKNNKVSALMFSKFLALLVVSLKSSIIF